MNFKMGLWSAQFPRHSANEGTGLHVMVKLLADVSMYVPYSSLCKHDDSFNVHYRHQVHRLIALIDLTSIRFEKMYAFPATTTHITHVPHSFCWLRLMWHKDLEDKQTKERLIPGAWTTARNLNHLWCLVPFAGHALGWKYVAGMTLTNSVMEWKAVRVMLPGSAVLRHAPDRWWLNAAGGHRRCIQHFVVRE